MDNDIDEVVVINIMRDLRDGELTEEFIESISHRNPAYAEALERYRLEEDEHIHNVAWASGEGEHAEVDTRSVEGKNFFGRFFERFRRLLR